VRSKIFSRVQQNFLTCAAKFSHVRGKIFSRARQNFHQDAAEFPSVCSRTSIRMQNKITKGVIVNTRFVPKQKA
jgi:hypothetical protein